MPDTLAALACSMLSRGAPRSSLLAASEAMDRSKAQGGQRRLHKVPEALHISHFSQSSSWQGHTQANLVGSEQPGTLHPTLFCLPYCLGHSTF